MSSTSDDDGSDGGPDIPDQSWTNPFDEGTPLHGLYDRRVRQSMDLVIIVSDYHNRRGTGKTICSLKLGEGMDRTDEGLTKAKVTLSPEEVREAYVDQPNGSALVLDEAEAGVDNRSSMTIVNRALREVVSMGRFREKYLVLNAPASSHIDKSLKELADVWILVTRRGHAIVHFFEYEPYSNKPLTRKKGTLGWDDIEKGTRLREVYNYLSRQKDQHMQGEEGDGFITREEHREVLEKRIKEERRKQRNQAIRAFEAHPEHAASTDVSHRTIGEAIGLAQPTISKIVNEDTDDDI